MYVHKCGGAFVADPNQSICPYCHDKINLQQGVMGAFRLVFRHIDSGAVSEFDLIDGQYLYIGRNNLKNANPLHFIKTPAGRETGKQAISGSRWKKPDTDCFCLNPQDLPAQNRGSQDK